MTKTFGGFVLVVLVLLAIHYLYRRRLVLERFITQGGAVAGLSLADLTTRALDSAPTTSEAKDYYKKLLVFADADIRKQGVKGLRILADFRDRLFGPRNFRADLTVEDFMTPWPEWVAPLSTTMKEPVPEVSVVATAESRLLAYIQKYYPQESQVDEQTGSTVRNIIDDFGWRFVFDKEGGEELRLRDDFLMKPLLQGWVNPAA